MGSPLMPTPARTASSRAAEAGRPRLLAPSPEISTTRRAALYGLSNRSAMDGALAPEIEAPPPNSARGDVAIASAKAFAEAVSEIRVHGTAVTCSAGPVHCIMMTAIDCVGPDWIAATTRGWRNAAA